MRSVEDVMPIRSNEEYLAALKEIAALRHTSSEIADAARLHALVSRVEAYDKWQSVDPDRLRALEMLVEEAQRLNMGY